jgi:8-oxo-dGTP pyrophosphatase MutT (NUDIX family)
VIGIPHKKSGNISLVNSFKSADDIQTHLTDPQRLYPKIRENLKNREIKTYKYTNVPFRKAAVIIPIFFKDHEAHLLLTKRTDKVEHHKGKISFPGGMHDSKDIDLKETALRETWEEMGIQSKDITILGRTDNFLTNTSFMVSPYVAHFPYPYPFIVNKDEISGVLKVPISHLLNPDIFKIQKWKRDGILWDVHFYEFNGENIWGVTGFLLSNFLSLAFGLSRMNNLPVG